MPRLATRIALAAAGRRALASLAVGLVLLLAPGDGVRAEGLIRPKPSEVAAGAPPGTVRRLIQPFGDWTLICDEDVPKRERVCTVSQSFVDEAGATVFSWSLAVTRGGEPVLILRAPNDGGLELRTATLAVAGLAARSEVRLSSCDAATCLGYLPVGTALGRALRQGVGAEVTLPLGGRHVTVASDLKYLAAALAALK